MVHDTSNLEFGSRCIHAGQNPDPATGAVIPALSLSTTFQQDAVGVHKGYDYARSGNPTRRNFEVAVAALENATHGLAFSSGSATLATIAAMIPPTQEIICMADVYGGTFRFLKRVTPHKVHFLDLDKDPNILKEAMSEKTSLVWIETPTNPTLRVVDIQAVSKVVKAFSDKIVLVVDNTFLTPYFQQPLKHGADIVVHSVSKYLNGHSDVIMGFAGTNSKDLYTKLLFLQNSIGAVPSPFDCFMANRGLKTLHVRMERHGKNAIQIAQALQRSPHVEDVFYPGLEKHPGYQITQKQTTGSGGIVTFKIKGGLKEADKFVTQTKLFSLAESLGGIESLCEVPALMTHASVPEESRKQLGISDNLIRLSVGIEDADDLVKDLEQALAASAKL